MHTIYVTKEFVLTINRQTSMMKCIIEICLIIVMNRLKYFSQSHISDCDLYFIKSRKICPAVPLNNQNDKTDQPSPKDLDTKMRSHQRLKETIFV